MTYAVMFGGIFAVHVLAMISPGPNVLIVTQTAMNRTRRARITTALGIATGATVWSQHHRRRFGALACHFGLPVFDSARPASLSTHQALA